jgi:hypothetical protein
MSARLRRNTVLHKAKFARRMQLKISICRVKETLFDVVHFRQIKSALRIGAMYVTFTAINASDLAVEQFHDGAMSLIDCGISIGGAAGI